MFVVLVHALAEGTIIKYFGFVPNMNVFSLTFQI